MSAETLAWLVQHSLVLTEQAIQLQGYCPAHGSRGSKQVSEPHEHTDPGSQRAGRRAHHSSPQGTGRLKGEIWHHRAVAHFAGFLAQRTLLPSLAPPLSKVTGKQRANSIQGQSMQEAAGGL